MRYQFFLDARDYVKFSLLEDLMQLPELEQLTIVWMLTPDRESGHGRKLPQREPSREALNEFFARNPRPHLRDIRSYFESRKIPCNSYGDDPSHYLTKENRLNYFDDIPRRFLKRALVFFDPDNGLEPDSGASALHLRYKELHGVWSSMSDESVTVVYQHRPRVKGDHFWPRVAEKLQNVLSVPVGWISAGDICFYIASKNRRSLEEARRIRLDLVYPSTER